MVKCVSVINYECHYGRFFVCEANLMIQAYEK
jgi:hypothetical protein